MIEQQNVRRCFRQMFQILIPPLAHHVPVKDGALKRIGHVFGQRIISGKRLHYLGLFHQDLPVIRCENNPMQAL